MPLSFSAEAQKKLADILSRYPNTQAALLPVLHLAQEEIGHLSDEALDLVARELKLPHAHVYGVVTFYTMYHREPVGKNVVMVCTNISCMLRGGNEVLSACAKRLGIKPGETTPDGKFTLLEEECLAACANAPMMMCGPEYFLDLTPEKAVATIDLLAGRPAERAPGT